MFTVLLFVKLFFRSVKITSIEEEPYILSHLVSLIKFSRQNTSQISNNLLIPSALSFSVSIFISPMSTIFSYFRVALSKHLYNSEKKVDKFCLGGLYTENIIHFRLEIISSRQIISSRSDSQVFLSGNNKIVSSKN